MGKLRARSLLWPAVSWTALLIVLYFLLDRSPALVVAWLAGLLGLGLLARPAGGRPEEPGEPAGGDEEVQHAQKLESLGLLAGGIAHDFNNLLMAVVGNADLALTKLAEDSPARGHVESIRSAAQRAADLAKQMLDYSAKGRFIVESLDLSTVVEELAPLLEASISKKAALELHLAPDLPPIAADPAQMRQVVLNLVTNASQAIGEASGVITITTGLLETGVFLEVSDTGGGMDRGTRDRIFEPFFTTKPGGRGLGLATAYGIVRGHAGTIEVSSEPGGGSTFRVLLPPREQPLRDETWQGSGTILVVDDELAVREVTKSMLRELGFEILTACDGREAVEVFRRRGHEIDLVLLDMTMPNMGGDEACREIRALRNDARILLTSGYNEGEATDRIRARDLAGFIRKPYQLEALRRKVREALSD
jgi:signal transduction histidine kinase/CheY-like chemotaxis protein